MVMVMGMTVVVKMTMMAVVVTVMTVVVTVVPMVVAIAGGQCTGRKHSTK